MLYLKNTYGKQKEPFIPLTEVIKRPLKRRFISIYTCGPTVYDFATIGNFSAYLMADLVKRYLRFLNYPVRQVINITDVGHLTADADTLGQDKIEEAAQRQHLDPWQIVAKFERQFLSDAAELGISADLWPKASDHITQMIQMIEKMMHNGSAYLTESGVYFDVTTFPDYGKLSGNTLQQLKAGARVEINQDKRHPADFALWKLNQPDHLMSWPSPWGVGYPGWHIECSAMSTAYLGEQIDVHTGGEDNIFPHHECEIAQSESTSGKSPFVRFWLHRQFLTVDGQKMSKSLGNTYRLQDIKERGYAPEDFRALVLASHYRSPVDFSWSALAAARERRLRWSRAAGRGEQGSERLTDELLERIKIPLDDDLNTPELFALIDQAAALDPSLRFWQTVDDLLGLGLTEVEVIPEVVLKQLGDLDKARELKNFSLADDIRHKIIDQGYNVSTTDKKSKVYRK